MQKCDFTVNIEVRVSRQSMKYLLPYEVLSQGQAFVSIECCPALPSETINVGDTAIGQTAPMALPDLPGTTAYGTLAGVA